MTEVNIPINLELRKSGITSINMNQFDDSDVVFVTVETYDNTIFFARYENFDKFINELVYQLLAHPSYFAAEWIELLKGYLISNRRVVENTEREIRN